jgi:hypothetical protein
MANFYEAKDKFSIYWPTSERQAFEKVIGRGVKTSTLIRHILALYVAAPDIINGLLNEYDIKLPDKRKRKKQ